VVNDTSHVVWGKQPRPRHGPDLKHTVLGLLVHLSASIFWAAVYEAKFGA
jgi:hypothetical protein